MTFFSREMVLMVSGRKRIEAKISSKFFKVPVVGNIFKVPVVGK